MILQEGNLDELLPWEPTSQYLRHFLWAGQGPQNTFLISCLESTCILDGQCSGKGKDSIISVELLTSSLFTYDTLAVNGA